MRKNAPALADMIKPKPKPKAKAKAKAKPAVKAMSMLPDFLNWAPKGATKNESMNVSVADVQKVLINNGYKSIKRDGLYGPKTALAWQTLAKGRKLAPTIARVGPKIARVTSDTYNTLSSRLAVP